MNRKPFLFFDIDDTLIDARTQLAPVSVPQTLGLLHDEGYGLALASGRSAFDHLDYVMGLVPWDYYVLANGHIIRDRDQQVIYRKDFPADVVRRCIDIARRSHVTLELKHDDHRFITNTPNASIQAAFTYFHDSLPPMEEYTGQPVTSMTCYLPYGSRVAELDRYSEVEMLYGRDSYCDIVCRGTSKVTAIRRILRWEGVEKFAAFGDSLNDLSMVAQADFGVAMGNACEELKQAADYVTAPVLQNGLRQAADQIRRMEW